MTFQEKLKEVAVHYSNGDLSPGFRKLADCILDVQDTALYRKFIDYTDWLHQSERTIEEATENARVLLQELSNRTLTGSLTDVPLLKAESIGKTYGKRKFQLKDVSMEILPGDVWGLVGENGNGKTTLLRILAGELSHDTGNITYSLSGEPLSDYDLRTRLVYIPQRTPRWFGSLKSNLKFTATHYGISGEENELLVLMMIIRFGLWNFRHHQWNELSSGYKMRFELARTFLRAPHILLLDEPLANLDVLAQQLILEDLRSLSQSISNPIGIILSSQQLFEVEKISDKVLFLRNGSPTHLSDVNDQTEAATVIECDVNVAREVLEAALQSLPEHTLAFNGGTYQISFREAGLMHAVLRAFADHRIDVIYIRDISQSTRRLFI